MLQEKYRIDPGSAQQLDMFSDNDNTLLHMLRRW